MDYEPQYLNASDGVESFCFDKMSVGGPKRTGKNTVEYLVVKEHLKALVRHVQHNLLEVAVEFFSCSLVPGTEVQNANNHSVEPFSRATSLMMVVLSCIEHDPTKFGTLTSAMQNIGLGELASSLTISKERKTPIGKSDEIPSYVRDSQDRRQANGGPPPTQSSATFQEVQHQDSSESGVVLKSKSSGSEACIKDSAYSDGQSTFTTNGDFPETKDEAVQENNSELLHGPTYTPPPTEVDDDVPAPVEQSASGANPEDGNKNELVTPSGRSFTMFEPGSEASRQHNQYQSDIASRKNEVKQQKAELDSLKSEHSAKESQLCQLKKEMSETQEENDRMVMERDGFLKKLKSDLANKNELIERLRSEKATIEARICELKGKCAEAVKNEKTAEERAAAVEEEFKEKEISLNKQLEELKALLELQITITEVVEENCEKLKEMQEVTDINHELEKRELARDKEVAEKEAQLMKTLKELAESRHKCAEMELEAVTKKLEEQQFSKNA